MNERVTLLYYNPLNTYPGIIYVVVVGTRFFLSRKIAKNKAAVKKVGSFKAFGPVNRARNAEKGSVAQEILPVHTVNNGCVPWLAGGAR